MELLVALGAYTFAFLGYCRYQKRRVVRRTKKTPTTCRVQKTLPLAVFKTPTV